jgi:proteasome lid subunit RPN8/RPN11
MSDELTPLKISSSILADIYREARSAFPYECCGWLSGPKDGGEITLVRACENAQALGTHPTEAQRGAETAYVITGDDLLSLNHTLESDTPAKVIFHSHPNGRAYLSTTDREVATSPWGDGPAYPVQQLVVGIDGDRVVEAALFAWSDDEGGFVQIDRFDGADV